MLFIKIKNKGLSSLTESKNKKVNNVNNLYSDISNLASSVRTFNSRHLLYPFFELQYARQRNSEIKLRNYNSFFNVIFFSFPILGTIFIIFLALKKLLIKACLGGAHRYKYS